MENIIFVFLNSELKFLKKIVYFAVFFILIVAIAIIIFDFGLTVDQIDKIIKIIPAFFSAAALLLTLSLYDKFGFKKFIYEKKIKAVLDYIELLRGLKIAYCKYSDNRLQYYEGSGVMSISSDMSYVKKNAGELLNLPIYVIEDNVFENLVKFQEILHNTYLPKELSKFPFHPYWNQKPIELPKEFIVLTFGDFSPIGLSSDLYCLLNSRDLKFIQFIDFNEILMKDIKAWVKRKTNLESDLKI